MKNLLLILITLLAFLNFGCQSNKWSEELAPQGIGFVCDSNRLTNVTSPSAIPLEDSGNFTAWKGEYLNAQFLAYSFTEDEIQFKLVAKNNVAKQLLPFATLYKLGWVKGDTRTLYADSMNPIVANQTLTLNAKEILPMWIQIKLPTEVETGMAEFDLVAKTSMNNFVFTLPLNINVLNLELPPVAESTYHLDFWQNPYSFAVQHNVELWSDEHFAAMRPYLEKLAYMGQRAVTVSMIDKPWNGQTHDDFQAMIEWKKKTDGTWEYDYTIFDRWVEFAASCGIDEAIHCYSMIPWHNKFGYVNEASGTLETLVATPGSPEFEAHWQPFLTDFQRHLEGKGWISKTAISMDERPEELMETLIYFVKEVAPKLLITSACNYQAKITETIDNISVILNHTTEITPEWIQNRLDNGKITTFYVCVHPKYPNTFIFSDPAEAQWLGWYAIAHNYSGVLRWAYNSWNADPHNESAFGPWPAGDCWLIYPGTETEPFITSTRIEKWHDGTEDYVKVQTVRELIKMRANADEFNKELDLLLKKFVYEFNSNGHKKALLVKSVEKDFNELVDKAFTLY